MNKYTIIGGGPAGLSIAYYANKKGLKYNVFEAGNKVGGNCITIEENGFERKLHKPRFDYRFTMSFHICTKKLK